MCCIIYNHLYIYIDICCSVIICYVMFEYTKVYDFDMKWGQRVTDTFSIPVLWSLSRVPSMIHTAYRSIVYVGLWYTVSVYSTYTRNSIAGSYPVTNWFRGRVLIFHDGRISRIYSIAIEWFIWTYTYSIVVHYSTY